MIKSCNVIGDPDITVRSGSLSSQLNDKLSEIQSEGCRIISVDKHNCRTYSTHRQMYVNDIEYIILYEE
jgi:hypothetical protein